MELGNHPTIQTTPIKAVPRDKLDHSTSHPLEILPAQTMVVSGQGIGPETDVVDLMTVDIEADHVDPFRCWALYLGQTFFSIFSSLL